MKFAKALLSLMLAACAGLALSQILQSETKALADTLFLGNMKLSDLEWERKAFSDAYRLPITDLCLDKPVEAASKLTGIHARAGRSVFDLLSLCRTELLADTSGDASSAAGLPDIKIPLAIPEAFHEAMRGLVAAVYRASSETKASLGKLTGEEKRALLEGLPRFATPEFEVEFSKVKTADQAKLLELLAKVDLSRIRMAAQRLAFDISGPAKALADIAKRRTFRGQIEFVAGNVPVEFSGVESNEHSGRAAQLAVDLGGNDRYTGRYGAGPGYASVLLDLGGDDVYDVPDLSIGAGVTGIGIAMDFGGKDVFRGKSLCFGAGLAGVGVFLKEGGDDFYACQSMGQGYAQFGIGLCVDTAGIDHYQAAMNAQGAASTQGVGWLVDLAGDDTYRAGGVILNSPLFADIHYSNAQGFGTGYREDTGGLSGGIGLLTDLSGDDAYIGETYCQAASYWFGMGSLYDAKGHDTYRAYHYSQSSAMHLCGAFLFDLAGDDSYAVTWGACHAIGHDYGVAFFLDRAGDDLYASRDASPGTGNANGLGVFIDGAGQDRYIGPPATGNPARGTGSLGVFVDMNGPDKFMDGLADGAGRVSTQWAVALDQESSLAGTETAIPPAQRPKPIPGSKPMPSMEALAELYRRATQWAVGTAQQDAAEAVDSLIEIGVPAMRWIADNKLANASRLEQSAYALIANGIGPEGRAVLAEKVGAGERAVVIPALGACIDGTIKEAAAYLPKALQNPETARLASRASGLLGGKELCNDLMLLTTSKDRLTALAAMVSLGQIGDPSALGTASAFLFDLSLPMRKAAMAVMAKLPEQSVITARSLAEDPEEVRARTGIEMLGLIGTPEALTFVGMRLEDPRAGVRAQALLALDGRCPAEFRVAFLKLREDPNPLVRALALRADVGR